MSDGSGKKGRRDEVAFIDFSKAYDRVDRGRLWRCLEGLGIGGSFLQFLRALSDSTSCRVKVDNKQSDESIIGDEFPVISGLRQGCVLSPLLFSLYINALVDTLKKHDCGIQCGNDIIRVCFSCMTQHCWHWRRKVI